MIIGVSSWALPWTIGVAGYPQPITRLDPLTLLELAAGTGAEAVQFADNMPLHDLERYRLQQLKGAVEDAGITLEIGTRGLDPDNLLRYLEIASILGAGLIRTLPHDGDDRPELPEAISRLRAVRSDFETAGIVLAVENHDLYPARWIRALVEQTGSPSVGVCLDPVNNLGQGEGLGEVMEALGDLTVNFHCKDFHIGRKPGGLGFDVIGRPAGEGMLDLAMIRRNLLDISWIIESWLPWQGDIGATTALEREWMGRGVANLTAFRDREDR